MRRKRRAKDNRQGDLFEQDAPKQVNIFGEAEFARTKRNDLTRQFDEQEEKRRQRILAGKGQAQ